MTFAELLADYLGNRKLEDVVSACAARNVRIDAPLLSRMRQGTRLPPVDDQAVRVLAEVCGRDPGPLLLLATIERKPRDAINAILSALSENGNTSDLGSLDELVSRVKLLRRLWPQRPSETLTIEIRVGDRVLANAAYPIAGARQA